MVLPAPAVAQEAATQLTGVPLTAEVQRRLGSLQEAWIDWLAAHHRGEDARQEQALEKMLAEVRALGLSRLPDLSRAAAAAAVAAARGGDLRKAGRALEAAERLDPGRPEAALARAHVERLGGSYFGALLHALQGRSLALSQPLERRLLLADLSLWALLVLLLAGAGLVAVLVAVRGPAVAAALVRSGARLVPRWAAYPLAGALLLWPLALPGGLVWVILYWSVLVWGLCSPSQRAVLIGLWLLVGITPALVGLQRQRVTMALTPPARALGSLEEGRLPGSLFQDLAVLRSILPADPAVWELFADLHREMGQWELAGDLYRRVLEVESDNVDAHLGLGAYHFQAGDLRRAEADFLRAVSADPQRAAAYFNLSQTYSADYRFGEAESALRRARELDPRRVSEWLHGAGGLHLVGLGEGPDRMEEIRRRLEVEWAASGLVRPWTDLWRRTLSLPLAVALIGLAAAVHLLRRRSEPRPPGEPAWWSRRWELARRILVPGVDAAAAGHGLRTLLAVLPLALLASLPAAERVTWEVPWGHDPGGLPATTLALLGVAVYYALRARREIVHELD